MKRAFIIAAILFQFIILFYMCGKREYIANKGQSIYLRTAPVDPRDLFRGDYVQLNYEVSNIIPYYQKISDYAKISKGGELYTVLKEHEDGLAELVFVTDKKPEHGLYLRGQFLYWGYGDAIDQKRPLSIRYGIEKYFVQQGKGMEMENKIRGFYDSEKELRIQTPFETKVSVLNGTGIITGHRWCSIGHDITIIWRNDNEKRRRYVKSIQLTLMNVSEKPMALVDLPSYASFSIEPQYFTNEEWIAVAKIPTKRTPNDSNIIVLEPGQKKQINFDINDKRFYFKKNHTNQSFPISQIEKERFRLVYRPPSIEECRHLKQRDIIWHGYLPSRAFTGMGYID